MAFKVKRGKRFCLYPNGIVYEGSKYVTTFFNWDLVDLLMDEHISKKDLDDLIEGGEEAIERYFNIK